MTLKFDSLRRANIARIPQFKNKHGGLAHSKSDGSDWSPAAWLQAMVGELGEYANIRKKFERGDLTLEEFQVEAAKELADVQIYLDILAQRCLDTKDAVHPTGVDLGQATIDKFNEVSERVGSDVRIEDPAPPATVRELIARLHQGDADAQIAADLLGTRATVSSDAQPVAPAVPEGFVPVPIVPTEAMCAAGNDANARYVRDVGDTYRIMLLAAPAPSVSEAQPREALSDLLVTLLISVDQKHNVYSDVQTHDNSFAEVAAGFSVIKAEIDRVFEERKSCPYYPVDRTAAKRKIIRKEQAAQRAACPAPDVRPSVPVSDEQIDTFWAAFRAQDCFAFAKAIEQLFASQPAAPVQQEPVAARPQDCSHTCRAGQKTGIGCAPDECDIESGARTIAQPQEAGQALDDEQIRFRFFKELSEAHRLAVFKAFGVYPDNCNESLNHGIERRLLDAILKRKPKAQAAPAVSEAKDALPPLPEDECIAHIYPSDLERMATNECTATVFSVAVGCPDETSVALYTAEQMQDYVRAAVAQAAPVVPDIKEMVNRFLGWKLPEDFYPDCFVGFDRDAAQAHQSWPIGTNLLTADQAKAMFLHCLSAYPSAPAQEGGKA